MAFINSHLRTNIFAANIVVFVWRTGASLSEDYCPISFMIPPIITAGTILETYNYSEANNAIPQRVCPDQHTLFHT